MNFPDEVRRAGFTGDGLEVGEALFEAILTRRSGVVFTRSEWSDVWKYINTADGRINLAISSLLDALAELEEQPTALTSKEFPFVLAAGERRSFTANTIFRDPEWRKRDRGGSLRICPQDAADLGIEDGGTARVSTAGGTIMTSVEITDTLRPGHVTLPNGYGLDYPDETGERTATGISPNELTVAGEAFEDPIAGTPYHKHVPARVETVR